MKKLEELGVSSTPWTVPPIDNDFVMSADGDNVCKVQYIAEDAPLIAAAPDLYHVAWCFDRLCEEERVDVKNPFVYEVWRQCRAALAKASGESEVK